MPVQTDSTPDEIVNRLIHAIEEIKYGSVTVIIQDGKIVQIEKHEKLRLR